MKIIKPSVEFFGAVPTDYTNALRFIEMAGRTCYKSEDKITADSAEGFVKRLVQAKPEPHLAMVEHSNFVVRLTAPLFAPFDFLALQGELGKYLNVHLANGELHVGGSLTAWMKRYAEYADDEQPMDDGLFTPFFEIYGELLGRFNEGHDTGWQVCPHNEIPAALHRYSAKFITNRAVTHEIVRHRPCSFAQESQRYVKYEGSNMEFIKPAGWESWPAKTQALFEQLCATAEWGYKRIRDEGFTAQDSRHILPNATKTEIIVTADAAEWAHIKKLRTAAGADPNMQLVMNMMPWQEMGL